MLRHAAFLALAGVAIEHAAQARGVVAGVVNALATLLVFSYISRDHPERWMENWMDVTSIQATFLRGARAKERSEAFFQFQKRIVGHD